MTLATNNKGKLTLHVMTGINSASPLIHTTFPSFPISEALRNLINHTSQSQYSTLQENWFFYSESSFWTLSSITSFDLLHHILYYLPFRWALSLLAKGVWRRQLLSLSPDRYCSHTQKVFVTQSRHHSKSVAQKQDLEVTISHSLPESWRTARRTPQGKHSSNSTRDFMSNGAN